MEELMKLESFELAIKDRGAKPISIGTLERELLKKYPASDAEEWDKTGLLVGDRRENITKVAVALDPTISAVRAAANAGANLLLTHHPVYRGGIEGFYPLDDLECASPSNVVYEAIARGIALMNFHTALDVSVAAHRVLPSLLHVKRCKLPVLFNGKVKKYATLSPLDGSKKKGYGQFVYFEDRMTLGDLARRCVSVFGKKPRVWGDMRAKIQTGACATGSAGDLVKRSIEAGIDVLICGEVRYHDALAGIESGCSIVELGHDLSELPLAALLANDSKNVGLRKSQIILLDQSHNWQLPDAIRI
jgi:putative NIF3 family GTP cyclohydrolase 1 type 2